MIYLDVISAIFCDCLGFSESNSPNFRMGENYCGYVAVREERLRELWRPEESA
jgi:hypothetical protein